MRIDLHTHSSRSDGTDTPDELIGQASAAGLDVIALTDHDTTVGWDEAREAADRAGLEFVPGIEISTWHEGRSVHLLGYGFDPEHAPLRDELARVRDGRDDRLPRMIAQLNALGLEVTIEDVHRHSPDAAVTGRPHVADALVEAGYVADRGEAFAEYLAEGRPGYADRYAADLRRAIALVTEAGGRSVLAHPWSRGSEDVLTTETISALRSLGLTGLEVDHPDHGPRERATLRALAEDLDLVITGSSDYHGTGKIDHPLGANTTDPEQFERLLGSLRA